MTSGKEKRILIVEDDLTLSRMLKTWLGKNGFAVDTASRVSDAYMSFFSINFIIA